MRQDNTTLLFGKGHLGGFIIKENPEITWTQRVNSTQNLYFNLEDNKPFFLPSKIETIIWAIPPHPSTVAFLEKLPKDVKIIFISSTSVFSSGQIKTDSALAPQTKNGKLLESAEILIKKHFKKYIIIRPGGLVDKARHPKSFFKNASKMNNSNHRPNLIHTEDVARLINFFNCNETGWNKCYNIVTKINLDKKAFYGRFISNKDFEYIKSQSDEKSFEMEWQKEIGFKLKYPNLEEYFK